MIFKFFLSNLFNLIATLITVIIALILLDTMELSFDLFKLYIYIHKNNILIWAVLLFCIVFCGLIAIYIKLIKKHTALDKERNNQDQLNSVRTLLTNEIDMIKDQINNPEGKINKALDSQINEQLKSRISTELIQDIGADLNKFAQNYDFKNTLKKHIGVAYDIPILEAQKNSNSAKNSAHAFQVLGFIFAITGAAIACCVFYNVGAANIWVEYKNNKPVLQAIPWTNYVPITLSMVASCEALAFVMFSFSNKFFEKMRAFYSEQSTLYIKCETMKALIEASNAINISKVLEKLVDTERNFILKKDEKTIEMANNQNNIEHLKAIAQALKPLSEKNRQ
jgi:hypothetical protein